MNKRATLIAQILETYFPTPTIPLIHQDAYTLLIAVLLSAQCTDARVNLTTPALFALADSPQKMIQLTVEEIQAIIKPCGLSTRKAKAIWQLSHDLLTHHEGQVPNTFEALEELPGVGHKTASVVMSQAFHVPAFPVDTHIARCAVRWKLSAHKTVEGIERDLKRQFPKETWNKIHLQMIYFARAFCPARAHKIDECPICKSLKSTRTG